jgi:microsomal epoxide hydrolase
MKALLRFIYCLALLCTAPLALANPMQSHYFKTSDGVQLHYLEAGQGEDTIVFIPGWLMPASIFERQLVALSAQYRVLAFDPRSQGQSQMTALSHAPARRIQDIQELITAAKVKRFILVGWSLGVLEVLDYLANNQPSGLRGLILIDNSVGEGKPPRARSSNFSQTMQETASREKYLREFSQGMFRETPPPQMMQAILDSVLRVPAKTALQLINQPYPRTHWSESLAQQNVPVLYAIRPRFRDQANALLEKREKGLIQAEIFESAGHALFVDDAQRFNALALAFSKAAFGR